MDDRQPFPQSQVPETELPPTEEQAFDQEDQAWEEVGDEQREDREIGGKRERHEEKLLLEWTAPNRPYKQRDREFYTTIGIIVFLVSLILFFAGQFLFIAVIISVAFVAYVLNTVPPEKIVNRVTTFGIHTGDSLFYWEELGRFWFTEQYGMKILNVETARAFPGVLILLMEGISEEELKKTLLKYTVYEKPKATWVDNSAKWLQEKFPLEKR